MKRFLLWIALVLGCVRALADTPAAVKVSPTDGPGNSIYGPILYDPSGNIMGIGNNSGVSSSYIYDPMGRLTVANVQRAGFLQSQSYVYDVYGNRTSATTAAGTTYALVDASNRLNSASYDAAGNLTQWTPPGSAVSREYEYDSLNMLTRESAGPGRSVSYIYTADDERYWSHSYSSGVEQSDYTIRDLDGKVLRHYRETAAGFSIANDYVYRDGLLLASVTPTATHHYSLDHLGTPRIVTNEHGHIIADHTYYPFGTEITDNSPTDGLLKFTGHERDADLLGEVSGQLDYMHARYYATAMGRFLSVDPGRDWDPKQPQSWNMYTYVRNNPVNRVDPTGRCGEKPEFIGPTVPCAQSESKPKPQRNNSPAQGQEPGTTQEFPNPDGGKTVRTYGPDGRAVIDVDYGHGHDGAPNPHVHDWDWGQKRPRSKEGRPPKPGEIPEPSQSTTIGQQRPDLQTIIGATILSLGGVGLMILTGGAMTLQPATSGGYVVVPNTGLSTQSDPNCPPGRVCT